MPGNIEFRHDMELDIVVSRPRWVLDSTVEVMRWYQLHVSYFSGRFREKKDVVAVHDAFDVHAKVATLWGKYRATLLDTYVRYSVRVGNNPRVRLTMNTSAARYRVSAVESPTFDEAVKTILAARAAAKADEAAKAEWSLETAPHSGVGSRRPE